MIQNTCDYPDSDIGFELKSSGEDIAYFALDDVSFLLQNFYIKEHADNFMMHLLVEDVDAWWQKINESGVEKKYSIKLGKPEDRPWKMRDFVFTGVSGVLWRIGQNI